MAAFGQHPVPDDFNNSVQMPMTVFLFDAESGQLRVRIPIPDVPPGYRPLAPAPPLAFDAESHLLAVATAKSVSLFSVPEGTPLISEALPETGSPSADQPLTTGRPPGLHDAHRPCLRAGAKRLFEAVQPSDLGGFLSGGSSVGQTRRAGRPGRGT